MPVLCCYKATLFDLENIPEPPVCFELLLSTHRTIVVFKTNPDFEIVLNSLKQLCFKQRQCPVARTTVAK